MKDVMWRSYDDHRDVMPFQDICWYSGWIMVDTTTKFHHLPEWAMRLYGRVHNILRLPTDVEPFELDEIAQTYIDFIIHVIMLADLWRTTWRYIFFVLSCLSFVDEPSN
ncbi:hypothetical protein MtrunA17_Chr5g0446261 [Medicago truncatula]|uniref:Uncharacterized protein n=1 Tax=Medicago truncatula TaxID=3880 RepID=G7K4M9_MEDTR|nr:hypothetical protein MTR_5g095460 [Medicago truncatula]AFK41589.1 unknown [Medicago truncatula]RHN57983.1 hypothetical protein MtrunA17_Chr5g0446261 [Medicago truncatula]